MRGLQNALRQKRRGGLQRWEPLIAPVTCALTGFGLMLITLALVIELYPESLFARFAVMLSGNLP